MQFTKIVGPSLLVLCVSGLPLSADAPHGQHAPATPQVHGPSATNKSATTHAPAPSAAPSNPTATTSAPPTSPRPVHGAPLNPVAAKIAAKPQLNARITALLPPHMTLNQASKGFRNQGQFIAALHASHNLGCDCFTQIKADMTTKHMSLGQAIQDVRKTANAPVEVHHAETERDDDLKAGSTSPTSTPVSNSARKPATQATRD